MASIGNAVSRADELAEKPSYLYCLFQSSVQLVLSTTLSPRSARVVHVVHFNQ